MKISQNGIDFIKKFESCKLYAYRDSVGVATIGYGHTKNVKMGMGITQKQADDFFKEDMVCVEKAINNCGVIFTQQQFDALCSFIFNFGESKFRGSTLYKKIRAKAPIEEITDQFVKWIYAGGKPLLGLKRRRVGEANMYLGKDRYYIDSIGNIKKR